jgi:protein-L-isoaspartate(D-aspartate) O-methyltransferase
MEEFEVEKSILLQKLRAYGISERVLGAMEKVPRHLFVPERLKDEAYEDCPLPIGEGQTISAPHMVGMMCDLLDLRKGQKILEIGAGSGYHAAVIAELVTKDGHVYTIERIPALVELARKNLKKCGYVNVSVLLGDGSIGLKEYSPYDGICVTCTAPDIPPPLVDQLKIGGRMVIPVGRLYQELYLVKKEEKKIKKERKGGVVFVPLIGKYGFR